MKHLVRLLISLMVIILGSLLMTVPQVDAHVLLQQPTGSIPTVTGTATGPQVRVNADNDFIKVRSGPGTDYVEIGILIAGEVVPAFGRTADGTWIQIAYAGVEGGIGWVYSPLVTLITGGDLPIVEQPPTATPRVTATIDTTLAAQFIQAPAATRMPTYTVPAPLVIPTFEPESSAASGGSFPVGLVIVVLGVLGILGALFSLVRGD